MAIYPSVQNTFESESEVTQSCPTLCNPMDCSPPGSSVHEILQARVLEWVAISSSRGSSQPRDGTQVSCDSCIGRWILYHCATWKAHLYVCVCVCVYTYMYTHTHIQPHGL